MKIRVVYQLKLWILREKQNRKIQRKKKKKKKDVLTNLYALFEGRERVLDAFKGKIFAIKIEATGPS